MTVRQAVVLAAGRGTRMQRVDGSAELTAEQQRAADAGAKALMPVGRPFLDYVLSGLADAGIQHVCLVVSTGNSPVRDRYLREAPPTRLSVSFAVQSEPAGTANALLSARPITGDAPFLVLNADNYYPVVVIKHMAGCSGACVAAFRARALTEHGNIPPSRLAAYAILEMADDDSLADIVEKPGHGRTSSIPDDALVGMNLWTFTPDIYEACAAVAPSERGEYELPQAVRLAVRERGMRIRCLPFAEGVLDLSHRSDVATVADRLRDVRVTL